MFLAFLRFPSSLHLLLLLPSGLPISGFAPICMSDPALAQAIEHLADSLEQLSIAIRPDTHPSGSSEGWELVGPATPVEPGSRAAAKTSKESSSLVDFGSVPLLRDVGEDLVSDQVFPYDLHQPEATPLADDLLAAARKWITEADVDRTAFYSAQEDPLPEGPEPAGKAKAKKAAAKRKVTTADLAQQMSLLTNMLPQLAEQLTAARERQENLEKQVNASPPEPAVNVAKPAHQQPFLPCRGPGLPVAKQASLIGPPRRTKPLDFKAQKAPAVPAVSSFLPAAAAVPMPSDPFQAAMLQQSQALSALVCWSRNTTVGSKGAARREKLQAALAARSGDFFLSVLQAASRRLQPFPVPGIRRRLLGAGVDVPVLRTFRRLRGTTRGYVTWCLAHVMDCLTNDDIAGAREFLAVTIVAIDQSSIHAGRWDFARLLTLLEEPPAQLFHGRGVVANPRSRAFSSLLPVGWTTCALQKTLVPRDEVRQCMPAL